MGPNLVKTFDIMKSEVIAPLPMTVLNILGKKNDKFL